MELDSLRLAPNERAVSLQNDFILMRHGQSLANERGLIVSRPENAITEYGLSAHGEQQVASSIAQANLSKKTLIVSSDYARALQTAKLAQRLLNSAEVRVDARLRERDFGDWELQDHGAYPTIWAVDQHSPNEHSHGVEPVSSVLNRALGCLTEIDKDYVGRQILVVGHGDVLQILLAYFAGIAAHQHRSIESLDNAELRPLLKP